MPIKHLTQGIEHFDEWFGAYLPSSFPCASSPAAPSRACQPARRRVPRRAGSTRSGLWVDLGVYGAPRLAAGLAWDAHPHPHPRPHPPHSSR